MALVLAKPGLSLAWAVTKSALTVYTPFWAGILLGVGITFWYQNNDNKNTTPKTIGQVMTGIGGALWLISLIILIILIRREMAGNPQLVQNMFPQGMPRSRASRFAQQAFNFPQY